MTLDDDLNAAALVFAQELADKNLFYHDPNLQSLGHGENLYASWTSDPNAAVIDYAKAVDAWYNEINDPGYDFETGGYQSGTGHFTQVVWKKSTKLGMAHAIASDGWIYVVARYTAPGNYLSQFAENVLPLGTEVDDSEPNDDENDTTGDDSGTDEGVEVSDHQEAGLAKHNELRALHGSPPMTLTDELNADAMDYAEHLASLGGGLVHDPNLNQLGQGENLFWAWSSTGTNVNYGNAVEAWYNEITDPGYDFSNPGWQPGAGHFTQVI